MIATIQSFNAEQVARGLAEAFPEIYSEGVYRAVPPQVVFVRNTDKILWHPDNPDLLSLDALKPAEQVMIEKGWSASACYIRTTPKWIADFSRWNVEKADYDVVRAEASTESLARGRAMLLARVEKDR